jgi:hypothetical protein
MHAPHGRDRARRVGDRARTGDVPVSHDQVCVAPAAFNAARLPPGCHRSRRPRRLPRPDFKRIQHEQQVTAAAALLAGAYMVISGTLRVLSWPFTAMFLCSKLGFDQSGRLYLNRRPLDPQDMGLAVLTGKWGSDGPALGAPTCWLCVWSQSGPKRSPGALQRTRGLQRQARLRSGPLESVRVFGASCVDAPCPV